MRKKGFTLVELLVVIAIIALLMSILMPALSKVRQLANRVVCGTNLKGIGSAMMLYAGDMDNKYPRGGGDDSQWGNKTPSTVDGADINTAYGNEDPDVPITASFYLLVKYDYTSTEQFLCKSDTGVKEFDATNKELYWDFFDNDEFMNPAECVSYSLQLPYQNDDNRSYYPNPASNPGLAVAGDRNPFIKNQACSLSDGYRQIQDSDDGFWWEEDNQGKQIAKREQQMNGNSPVHQQEGQNVLFNDGHVNFEDRSFCGVEDDNIYTYWDGDNPDEEGKQKGVAPEERASTSSSPMNREDTLLLNDTYDDF